ncbi:MAG: HD domain-containing phosphohydrolase [Terriglobia bacterium]|jgi:putative nucleotidyltransferase with HDIG domain
MWSRIVRQFQEVNKELWLLLMMFAILAGVNYLISSERMLLGFYVLPSVYSAYFRGRRHATLTAVLSLLLVVLIVYTNPHLFTVEGHVRIVAEKWWDIAVWGGTLMVIAYAMGTLYEKKQSQIVELRDAYKGIVVILRQMTAHDEYTHNHCFRVAAYATTIAKAMGFDSNRVSDVWDASLLHDLGKLDTSRELLYKAERFTASEYEEMKKHVEKGAEQIEPVRGPLFRIIPIILAHHDRFDGSGYHPTKGEDIPLEARVIAVADVYDAMTSDRPYAKAMSPLAAKEAIAKGAGTDFDPSVVKAFVKAFQSGSLEVDFTALDMLRA